MTHVRDARRHCRCMVLLVFYRGRADAPSLRTVRGPFTVGSEAAMSVQGCAAAGLTETPSHVWYLSAELEQAGLSSNLHR